MGNGAYLWRLKSLSMKSHSFLPNVSGFPSKTQYLLLDTNSYFLPPEHWVHKLYSFLRKKNLPSLGKTQSRFWRRCLSRRVCSQAPVFVHPVFLPNPISTEGGRWRHSERCCRVFFFFIDKPRLSQSVVSAFSVG